MKISIDKQINLNGSDYSNKFLYIVLFDANF